MENCINKHLYKYVQAGWVLNADLQTISQLANYWLVLFNAMITNSMVISRKSNLVQHPFLFVNGTIIDETESHNLLGFTLSKCMRVDHVI